MDIHAVLSDIVLACKLLEANVAGKALPVLVQVALHVSPQAAPVVEGTPAVAALGVLPSSLLLLKVCKELSTMAHHCPVPPCTSHWNATTHLPHSFMIQTIVDSPSTFSGVQCGNREKESSFYLR